MQKKERMELIAVTRVYGHKQVQIPKEVAKKLAIEDGDKVLWYEEEGKIYILRTSDKRPAKVECEFTGRALGIIQ